MMVLSLKLAMSSSSLKLYEMSSALTGSSKMMISLLLMSARDES